MKLNALVPLFCFAASVLSCGAPEEVATDSTNSDITVVSEALCSGKDKEKDKEKCKDQCEDKCHDKKQAAKKACKDACKNNCEAGGGGGSGGSTCAPNQGQPCDDGCGGVITCLGKCSRPPATNSICAACQRESGDLTSYITLCDGSCSTRIDVRAGQACGFAGRVLCNGTCSSQ